VGLLDKLKEGAGQAKDYAQQAAEKAKDEAKELQLKRQLGSELEELGRVTFDLVQRGELTHGDLAAGVQRVTDIKAQLAELAAADESAVTETGAGAPPASG